MGTHPIFESDFDCLTDMRKRPKDPVKSKTTRSGSKLRSGSKASGKISKKVPLNICEKSKRRKFMQLYSTTKKPLNERFTKIMKQRKKLEIAEEIEIQVSDVLYCLYFVLLFTSNSRTYETNTSIRKIKNYVGHSKLTI